MEDSFIRNTPQPVLFFSKKNPNIEQIHFGTVLEVNLEDISARFKVFLAEDLYKLQRSFVSSIYSSQNIVLQFYELQNPIQTMINTGSLAPQPLTMDRLGDRDELIIAQSTSQCCRFACFQPSINWVVAEGNNFEPGTNPFSLDSVAWIHEESSFIGRCLSYCGAGFRGIKYIQHSGPPPTSIMGENQSWFTCQFGERPETLSEADATSNVIATHEKGQTCGVFCCWVPCVCNACGLPYLETKDGSSGATMGTTQYVCDMCCAVPKYDILDASGEKVYHLRPNTCIFGMCPQCRCDGKKGKCFRIPFIIRDPSTLEPIPSGTSSDEAMVDTLWAGWKNECCSQRNAYHVIFPKDISPEQKVVLMGSALLVDVTMFEQNDDNNS